MIAGTHAVLWVKQDWQGNDACRFADAEGGYLIDGSSTDAGWDVLRYRLRARGDGTTRRVRIGARSRLFVRRAPDDSWTLNGTAMPEVSGAQDIDLGFTPAWFTLPIRRLGLAVGQEAELMVARLDIENHRLVPRHVTFRHTAPEAYDCIDTEAGHTAQLQVDRHGNVRAERGRWQAQA